MCYDGYELMTLKWRGKYIDNTEDSIEPRWSSSLSHCLSVHFACTHHGLSLSVSKFPDQQESLPADNYRLTPLTFQYRTVIHIHNARFVYSPTLPHPASPATNNVLHTLTPPPLPL